MMKYFYTEGVAWPYALKTKYEAAGVWPEIAGTDISEVMFAEFTSTPPAGKIRGTGSDGYPAWVDAPPLTYEQLVSAAEALQKSLLSDADAVIADWRTELMLNEISDENRAKLSAWLAYKNEVRAVDYTGDPEHVIWPAAPDV